MSEQVSYGRRNLELRAAEYYASIRKPESEWKTIEDLKPQLAEFEHRIRAYDYKNGYYVLDSIDYHFLYLWGYYTRLIEKREMLLDSLTDQELKAMNWDNLGRAYRALYKVRQAIEFYEKALPVARKVSNKYLEASILRSLGLTYYDLGQFDLSIKFYEQALTITRSVGDRWHENIWLSNLGLAYYSLGQVELAIQFYTEALFISREVGDRWGEGVRLDLLAVAFFTVGKMKEALDYHKKALAVAREVGDRRGESYRLLELAKIFLISGNLSLAEQYLRESLDLDILETKWQNALVLGIVYLYISTEKAAYFFKSSIVGSQFLLEKIPDLYKVCYTLATAFIGQAVCTPRWADPTHRVDLLAPALAKYRHALNITAAPGVVSDALHDLELIRAAGIEGLEPVFNLLEGALNE